MTTFVALLRGVNVGKATRVPMAEFRALLVGLGYTRVVTLLNSGNAVFRAAGGAPADHAAAIAAALAAQLNVEVPVIVKSAAELAATTGASSSIRLRMDSPFSSMRCALCTMRSRMA